MQSSHVIHFSLLVPLQAEMVHLGCRILDSPTSCLVLWQCVSIICYQTFSKFRRKRRWIRAGRTKMIDQGRRRPSGMGQRPTVACVCTSTMAFAVACALLRSPVPEKNGHRRQVERGNSASGGGIHQFFSLWRKENFCYTEFVLILKRIARSFFRCCRYAVVAEGQVTAWGTWIYFPPIFLVGCTKSSLVETLSNWNPITFIKKEQ